MKLMEMFLLASVNTEKKAFYTYNAYTGYGLSGIAVAELVRMGRLDFNADRITVRDTVSTGDELLDEVLQVIAAKEKPKKTNYWIAYIPYRVKKFTRRAMERLEDNGILLIEKGRVLLMFPSTKYIVTNVSERNRIVNTCRDVLLKGEKRPEYEIMLLISVAAACGFVHRYFSREERRGLRETFRQLRKGTYFELPDGDLPRRIAIAVKKAITVSQATST